MDDATPPRAERESHAGVLGIAVGLLMIVAAALALSRSPESTDIDPGGVIAGQFDSASLELPGGYEYVDASRTSEGDRILRWTLGGVVPEPATKSDAKSTKEKPGDVDWLGVEAAQRGEPPEVLYLVDGPRDRSKKLFERYFRDLPGSGVADLSGGGGNVVIESGTVDWHGLDANFVRQRKFEVEGGEPRFRDTLRVNLTRERACILIASWSAGSEGSLEALASVLDALRPGEPTE